MILKIVIIIKSVFIKDCRSYLTNLSLSPYTVWLLWCEQLCRLGRVPELHCAHLMLQGTGILSVQECHHRASKVQWRPVVQGKQSEVGEGRRKGMEDGMRVREGW